MLNRSLYYLLDEHGNPYPTEDRHAASELLGNIDKRRVGLTEKDVAGHHIMASTVFLVIDHSFAAGGEPDLFETMLFIDGTGNEIGSATKRYHTREEAIQGHAEIVEGVEKVLMMMQQQNIDISEIAGLLT